MMEMDMSMLLGLEVIQAYRKLLQVKILRSQGNIAVFAGVRHWTINEVVRCLEVNEQKKKKILPVGTTLTIVGEAIKGDDGKTQIQKPHKGTLCVSQMNIDQLIEDYENNARLYLVDLVDLFTNT
ncbi:unnamed protein product [Musa textilis]